VDVFYFKKFSRLSKNSELFIFKNLSIGSRFVPCVRTKDGQTNITNSTFALHRFAKAPKSR